MCAIFQLAKEEKKKIENHRNKINSRKTSQTIEQERTEFQWHIKKTNSYINHGNNNNNLVEEMNQQFWSFQFYAFGINQYSLRLFTVYIRFGNNTAYCQAITPNEMDFFSFNRHYVIFYLIWFMQVVTVIGRILEVEIRGLHLYWNWETSEISCWNVYNSFEVLIRIYEFGMILNFVQ